MLLCIITIFTLLPIEAFANGGLWVAGVSTGAASTGGSGNWNTSQQGYRISIIDPKTATTVTNKVDFIFGNPPGKAVYCSNNKIEGFHADNSKYEARANGNLRIISASDPALLKELQDAEVNPNWPKHTLWNGAAQSNGEFRDWFLKGELGKGGGAGKLPPSYTGGNNSNNNSNKRPTGGSSKPTGSGQSTSSTPSSSTSTVDAKCREIRSSMHWEYTLKYASGMSMQAAAAAAESKGYSIVCDLELADEFTPAELQRMNAEVKKYAKELASPTGIMGVTEISPLSPAYNDLDDSYKQVEQSQIIEFNGGALFDIAYAAPEYDSTEDGAAYVIMNFKQGGQFVFAFNNNVTLSQVEDPDTHQLVDSILQTVCDNDYYILVEPILWFIPEKYRQSPEPKHYSPYMDTFYGTVTNYAQFAMETQNKNVWSDGGSGGNYGNLCNKVGAHTLHLAPKENLYMHDASGNPIKDKILIEGVSTTNSLIKNNVLQNNKKGYAVQYYWGKPSGFQPPSTQTYDTFETDPNPNPIPHKAPNPDPNYKTSKGKTPVPFTEGEPKEPETSDYKGYKQITRTCYIVKCYDIEHLDGTLEHVITKTREYNPGQIAVMDEPDYKVVEYFTSPGYYGRSTPPLQNTPYWSGEDDPNVGPVEWQTMFEICGIDYNITFNKNYPYDENREAGTVLDTVKLGIAADLEYNPETDTREPNKGYDDNALYVHLIKKEHIPETSTWDGNPPGDTPPPDPLKKPQTDPETDPDIEQDNPFLNHEIVKVYQVKDWSNWVDGMPEPDWEHVSTYYQYPTAPVVTVENEKDYQLAEWKAAWKIPNPNDKTPTEAILQPSVTSNTDWDDAPISSVTPFKSGVQPAKVEIYDTNDISKPSTIYVLLRKEIPPEPPGDGAIIVQQSQITKTVRTNDLLIANKLASMNWGNYSFHYQIGDFSDAPDSHRHGHGPFSPPHSCYHVGNEKWVDQDLNLWFHQLTPKVEIQIPDGKFIKTDNAIYSGNTNQGIIHKRPEKITINTIQNYNYVGDGKTKTGEELVTVLWRQGLKDKPILAAYKQRDITSGNDYILKGVSATNWTDSLAIVDKADRKAGGGRLLDNGFELTDLQFSFGITQGEGDHHGATECPGCGCCGCHRPIPRDRYLSVTSGGWTQDFLATVCVRTYKGRDKAVAAQPYGMGATPQKEIRTGKHMENNVIQSKQQIKFFPYIRMTYMLNTLDEATKEAQNTDSTGYKQDVRKDTYVISEYESRILPSDAVEVGWTNPKDGESLMLTSQQWSLHQKAINGSDGWQGRNQVLPGGAIYQLSTPQGSRTTVHLKTYQTVVDEKARQEYLTSTSTLTGDEYTVKRVTADHLSFVNDAKETLDNLKIVQWVYNPGNYGTSNGKTTSNKFNDSMRAYPNNFDETHQNYICLFHNGSPRDDAQTKLSQLDKNLTRTPSTDSKYYMHSANVVSGTNGKISVTGKLADYQSSTKLSDITSTIINNDAKQTEPVQGDLDITKIAQETTVYKVFTDTSGNIYMISDSREGTGHIDQVEADINAMMASMKDINADTYDKWSAGGKKTKEVLATKSTSAKEINSKLSGDAKIIDNKTGFITNIALSVIRNSGTDKTAEWVNGPTEGRWYNEGFDGIYLVKQYTKMEVSFGYPSTRVSALDPALCPPNKGQSDLYTNAYLSQFLVDSHSDAAIAQGKAENYIGTFKDVDITLPDMESMYISRKFYIPNANVQDLN